MNQASAAPAKFFPKYPYTELLEKTPWTFLGKICENLCESVCDVLRLAFKRHTGSYRSDDRNFAKSRFLDEIWRKKCLIIDLMPDCLNREECQASFWADGEPCAVPR